MSISENLEKIKREIPPHVKLIAVSKSKPIASILEVYDAGHKIFGENKVQEMLLKYDQLPKDIEWHFIGHLQTNKVKHIIPFVSLIHSVDSYRLLHEINKEAVKKNKVINCLLQIHIAKEETKFGLSQEEAEKILSMHELKNVKIIGIMGMATNMDNTEQIRNEFHTLKNFYNKVKLKYPYLQFLSMGMSSDYKIAIEEGSNMIRIGSILFGIRN